MAYKITTFTLNPDYDVEVSEGGQRPLIAKATIEMPGAWSTERPVITLSEGRLETLLNVFQRLVAEEIIDGLTRDDDVLVGRCDVVPKARSAEQIIAELSPKERAAIDVYVDAAVLRGVAVTDAATSS